jgi:pimeloyl-ACP methyl ester carboxylesterase
MKYCLALLLVFLNLARAAEVIPIQPLESCFLCSSAPSLTLYWQGKDSKAVLMLIPGGEGYIGLKPGQTDNKFHQFQTLKRLTDPTLTRGHFDVVLLDSPAQLSPNQAYPSERGGFDHMIRIESAVRYYREKTGLPVWLMGHSNGGISLTEFLKYARKNNRTNLIGGYVVSAVRNESYFEEPIAFPMLFMHHQSDGCSHTTLSASFRNYEKVKAFSAAPAAFVTIQSGQTESRDPCRSGFHMYYGAGEEVAQNLDDFMSGVYK